MSITFLKNVFRKVSFYNLVSSAHSEMKKLLMTGHQYITPSKSKSTFFETKLLIYSSRKNHHDFRLLFQRRLTIYHFFFIKVNIFFEKI
ncbi:hypothetical protein BA724_13890 [Domibacillus iocasae]|uniref:Uncharacterized protein n=1 Tax=Domibacillus iocasae TaxID=1714016 RepID=A0A1E7DKI8_9BACI|nr:hypothetical protein BA724_13890 [Domibacillus iocasae]